MASLVRQDSNSTQYSWWWVSHISPKNSKWLQENVTDMDAMVKAMIKLINEDADSFARRAEMYYKKRPELMKHVEEFYRAYRALAERYDQATGALRQAHRTISEAFPNQMPSLTEESSSSGQQMEPHTPEMRSRTPFDADNLHKDALGVSPQLHTIKRNGTHPDEISLLSSRKGLKQFNDLFATSDNTHRVSYSDGKVRKGLSFESPDIKGKEDVSSNIMHLQDEISKLLAERETLKQQISSESERANNAESKIQSLKDSVSSLILEKDTTLLQYSESIKRLSDLEFKCSRAHTKLKEISDCMAMEVEKLNCAESRNSEMQSELDTLVQEAKMQEQELVQSRKEMESLQFYLQDEVAKRKQAEDALSTREKQCTQSLEEAERLALEMKVTNDKLSEFKQVNLNLENTVCELKKEVARLTEQNHFSELLIEELHGNINFLVDSKSKVDSEIQALKNTVSQLNIEKDVSLLEHRQCIKEVSGLELKLSNALLEQEKIELKVQILVHELEQKREATDVIHAQWQDEHFSRMQKEAALLAMENLHSQSQEEAKKLTQDLEHLKKRLCDLEQKNLILCDKSQGLEKMVSELNSEKNAAILQQQKSLERVSYLEAQLSVAQLEMKNIVQKAQMLEQELEHKNREVGKLQSSLQKEEQKCLLAETALLRVEQLHSRSQEEANTLAKNIEMLSKKLSEVENDRLELQNMSQELKNTISDINSEKDTALLQQLQSLERASYFETQFSYVQSELGKTMQKVQLIEQELKYKNKQVDGLQDDLKEEGRKRMHAEAALLVAENLQSKSQEEMAKLMSDLGNLNNELSAVKESKLSMEELLYELRNTISHLNTEKDSALLQQQLSLEEVSDLNSQVSNTQLVLRETEQKLQMVKQDLTQKSEMMDFLQLRLQHEDKKRMQAEMEIEMLNRKLNELESLSSELKNTILLLNSEKDTINIQHKQSLERTSDLTSKLSEVQAELENAGQQVQMLDKEFKQKSEEVDNLQTSLQDESRRRIEGEAALLIMTNLHSQSQEEVNKLALQIDNFNRKLNEIENVSSELKNTILLLNSEKDTTLLQHEQSLVRLSHMEIKLSKVQAKLQNAEQKVQMLDKELEQKRETMDTLQISLKGEVQKRNECEAALIVMTDLHSQSQQEVSRFDLQIEKLNGKLNEVMNINMDLENMIAKHAEDINILGEHNHSAELTIKGLHDELDMSNEMKAHLENEVGLHIGEKKVLQQDLARQKEDNAILNKQQCSLEHEMNAVYMREATLEQSMEELRNNNLELKEACTVHDIEKALLLEKVCEMEKLSEEHSILKKSFSNAVLEMEALKGIIKELEASESSLKRYVSLHSSEKDALSLELEILGKKYADVSEKSSILETSFYNLNSEADELRVKLKDSEEISWSYLADNSALLAEKDIIFSQLEGTIMAIKSLEDKHTDLVHKNSSLLAEKDLLCSRLRNLHDQLGIKNEQNESLLKSHQIQVNDFQERISSLQEKIHYMDQMFEQEQQKCTNSSFSTLILKNSLVDVETKYRSVLNECQKFIEATHSAEVLIAQLKEEAKIEEEENKALLQYNKKLRDGILQQIKVLNICKNLGPLDAVHDEIILQTMAPETLSFVKQKEESEYRKVFMDTELLVLGTIMAQIVTDFSDLHLQKCELVKKVETGAAELSFLQNKNNELVELNQQLWEKLQQSSKREGILKIGMLGLYEEISGLRESYETSQNESYSLTRKHESLFQEYEILAEKSDALNDENADVLAECLMLDHLSLFFSGRSNELTSALSSLNNDMDALGLTKHELDHEVKVLSRRSKILEVECQNLRSTLENLLEILGTCLVLSEFDSYTCKRICQELATDLKNGIAQVMQKDDKLSKADEKVQILQETNQKLCRVLRDLEVALEDAKTAKGGLENKIIALTEQGAIRDNEISLLCKANMALQEEVGFHKQKVENLTYILEMVTEEAEQREREIVVLLSDIITCSVNAMIYEEQVLGLMMECEALEIRLIAERDILIKEISLRDVYIVDLHKKIGNMGGENAELKAELNTYLPLVASLSDQITVLEGGTLLLSELNKEGKLEFVQEDRHSSGSHDNPSGALELQSLIARVEALRVVILDAKDRRDKEVTESASKLEAASVEIQGLKISKGVCSGRKERYMEDDRQNFDAENSKGKQVQIMKDIELDQVSTCSPYGTGATIYPLGGDANAELDDEMLQLWETAEKDYKNQTAKSSSSEHDIQAVEEVKSEYPSFELARGRDLGIDRLELSTVSLEPQQLWRKNVLEKLASDAQRLSIIQTSIDEAKQKMECTSKGKSPTSSEYSSIRAQLQEIEGLVWEYIDFNSNLTKKADNYPALEVNAELETYSSRRKISEQVQKGTEKVARLELELQKIQYVLLKLEEEHEYKRVKVSEKRSRVLLRDYMYGRKDRNEAGQKKKKRVPFCGCVRLKTRTDP